MTDNALKTPKRQRMTSLEISKGANMDNLTIIKDELARIENDRQALVEMGSESKTKAKVFLYAKALSVAVTALEHAKQEFELYDKQRNYIDKKVTTIANILSDGEDGI